MPQESQPGEQSLELFDVFMVGNRGMELNQVIHEDEEPCLKLASFPAPSRQPD